MPKPGKILKISALIIICVYIVIFGTYFIFKLDKTNLTSLLVGGGAASITLFIAVFQILGKKDAEETSIQINKIEKDVSVLKENDEFLSTKISGFNARFMSLEDQNKFHENALEDIRIGIAEKEEADFYVYMHVKHKNDIMELCKNIKNQTYNALEDQSELDLEIRKFIIELIKDFSNIVIVQYETGFDKFEGKYYKTEILNAIDLNLESNNLHKQVKEVLHKEFKNVTNNYINSVNLILANQDNGERRNNFMDRTLRFAENLTNKTLNTTHKKQIA